MEERLPWYACDYRTRAAKSLHLGEYHCCECGKNRLIEPGVKITRRGWTCPECVGGESDVG